MLRNFSASSCGGCIVIISYSQHIAPGSHLYGPLSALDKTVIRKMSVCFCMCVSLAFRALNLPPCEEFLKNCMPVYYSLLQLWILGEWLLPPICSGIMAALFRWKKERCAVLWSCNPIPKWMNTLQGCVVYPDDARNWITDQKNTGVPAYVVMLQFSSIWAK